MYQDNNNTENLQTASNENKNEKNSALLWISLIVTVFLVIITILALVVFLPTKSQDEQIINTNETLVEKEKMQEQDNELDQLAQDMATNSEKALTSTENNSEEEASDLSSRIEIRNYVEIPEDKTTETVKTVAEKPIEKVEAYVPQPKPVVKKEVPKKVVTPAVATTKYYIQIGSFEKLVLAENAKSFWTDKGLNTIIKTKTVNEKTMYRVQIGTFQSKTEVDAYLVKVKNTKGFENAFITSVKVK